MQTHVKGGHGYREVLAFWNCQLCEGRVNTFHLPSTRKGEYILSRVSLSDLAHGLWEAVTLFMSIYSTPNTHKD